MAQSVDVYYCDNRCISICLLFSLIEKQNDLSSKAIFSLHRVSLSGIVIVSQKVVVVVGVFLKKKCYVLLFLIFLKSMQNYLQTTTLIITSVSGRVGEMLLKLFHVFYSYILIVFMDGLSRITELDGTLEVC